MSAPARSGVLRADKARVALGLSLTLLVAAVAALGQLGPRLDAALALLGYGALFVPYAMALLACRRVAATGHERRLVAALIVAAALLARLSLCGLWPLFSDDLYRYVWDGWVLSAGHGPYSYAPDHQALAALRDAHIWPRINHPHLPTIYPPLAQYAFWLATRVGDELVMMRLLWIAVEALGVAGVAWLCRARCAQPGALVALAIYALNPLVIVEVAWSGHVDALAWAPLAAALAWPQADARKRASLAQGALLGLSVAAKLLGVIALPLLLWRALASWRLGARAALGRACATAASCALVVALCYAPLLTANPDATGSLATYAASWRNNDGLYRALHHGALAALEHMARPEQRVDPTRQDSEVILRLSRYDDAFMARGWTKVWQGQTLPNTSFSGAQAASTLAKAVAAFLMALLLLWCVLMIQGSPRQALWLFWGLMMVAPTVMPWYVAWLVPLASIVALTSHEGLSDRALFAPLLFSAACLLGYVSWASARQGGPWAIPAWVVAVEFISVGALALASALRGPPGGPRSAEAHDQRQ